MPDEVNFGVDDLNSKPTLDPSRTRQQEGNQGKPAPVRSTPEAKERARREQDAVVGRPEESKPSGESTLPAPGRKPA